jgi:hypothetical protein|tara:strand:+ start:119 stop:292 length:174 start_codon:yes stop_codon:yes gene_type:complete
MKGIIKKSMKNSVLAKKNIDRLKNEFHQNRYDDKNFAECYNKDDFWQWIKDYNIRIT